ncbi:hypothetical protein P152DRAFT_471987 [Eremomyces bilateralis CBS 781.70]|uniref:Uncharacterized protein n=1 Tax=Eremomyces bilateralis CBS 781.70 TaxID=1392243 RepID=A0A6G1G8F5_9PEZI|nr:uncharacterized protein P152DRAFT_471987 [Eremomyces bilateralis CBS 781.70]KAF1814206.1 hypothetical protein P152DRAFT_471987 [Eremomyces bilateralis CBS 781.70]
MEVESCLQGIWLQTPVTSEALPPLQIQIEDDAQFLDGPSKHRLQKLASAAQKAFAEHALLLGKNRLLFEQNNESNSRQSARSTVAGKAKVISYEDIVKAQAKHDAKKSYPGERKTWSKAQKVLYQQYWAPKRHGRVK